MVLLQIILIRLSLLREISSIYSLQKNKDLFLLPGDMYISSHSPSSSKALKEKLFILYYSEKQCLQLMRRCTVKASSRNMHVALWLESIQWLPCCSSMDKNENIVYPSVFLRVKSQI